MGGKESKASGQLLGKDIHTTLKDMLDFGPDKMKVATPNDGNERIKKLVKQLQEINSRIDKLSQRF